MLLQRALLLRRSARCLHQSSITWKDVVIAVPKMGDSITEGTLIAFKKQSGEAVKLDDIVAVIETDKARGVALFRIALALSPSSRSPSTRLSRPPASRRSPPPLRSLAGFGGRAQP